MTFLNVRHAARLTDNDTERIERSSGPSGTSIARPLLAELTSVLQAAYLAAPPSLGRFPSAARAVELRVPNATSDWSVRPPPCEGSRHRSMQWVRATMRLRRQAQERNPVGACS